MMIHTELIPGDENLIVYFCGEHTEADGLIGSGVKSTVLLISGFDWNRHLSPWPADRVFRKGEDFGGEADVLIEEAEKHIRSMGMKGHCTCAGYSLAGLFALYFCTKTDLFDGCISASGSLWYPGFLEYLRSHPVNCSKVYLSLGDKEKNTKNPVMSAVEQCTEEAAECIGKYAHAYFELNEGNHFADPVGRMVKGMKYVENYEE